MDRGGYRETQQYSRPCNCKPVCTRTFIKQHLLPLNLKSPLTDSGKGVRVESENERGPGEGGALGESDLR